MKTVKSLLAVMLVLLLMFSFTGCLHKQNEIAVEIGGVKFTAAQYSYALLMADSEAQEKVSEQLSEEGIDPTVTEVDIYSRKIGDVNYVTWVENRAIELLGEYAAYQLLFTDAKLSLSADAISQNTEYADYYYSYYQGLYEANGIGKETYAKMVTFDSYANEYFNYLYGKEGTKAVSAEEINKSFTDSYRVVLILQTDVTQKDEAAAKEAKDSLNHYKEHLEKGESIVDVYNEFNGLGEESAAAGNAPAEKELDVVSIVSDPEVDESYGVDFWADVVKIEAGKSEILEAEENGSKYVRLVYVVEIKEGDTSYVDQMDASIRWNLKGEDFEKEISDYAKGLTVVKHEYAMSAFKVKKINYGEQ